MSLGATEIEILRYIGEQQPITVGDVAIFIAETSGQARTTVLTIMERLRKKRYLVRKQINGVFHYSTKVPMSELMQNLVGNFVEQTLGGTVSPFVAYLSENGPLSQEDLQELKQLVKALENGNKST